MAPFPTDLLPLIRNRCSGWLVKKTIENNLFFGQIQAFPTAYSFFVVLFVATMRSWPGVGMKSSSCEAAWLQPRANVPVSAMSVWRCSRRSYGSARRWMTCAKSPRWSKRRLSCRWVTFLPLFHSNISVEIYKKAIKFCFKSVFLWILRFRSCVVWFHLKSFWQKSLLGFKYNKFLYPLFLFGCTRCQK